MLFCAPDLPNIVSPQAYPVSILTRKLQTLICLSGLGVFRSHPTYLLQRLKTEGIFFGSSGNNNDNTVKKA
jgi:hypothetical protein